MFRMLDMLYWLATRQKQQPGGANRAAVAATMERQLFHCTTDVPSHASASPVTQFPSAPGPNARKAACFCQDFENSEQGDFLASHLTEMSRQSKRRKITMARSGDDNHPSSSDSSYSSVEEKLNTLHFLLSRLSQSHHDFEDKFNEISEWINKQKAMNWERQEQLDVATVLTATINAIEKFESQDPLEVTRGVLHIMSSLSVLEGGPCARVVGPLFSIIGALLTITKPDQPSVVDQLAQVVHEELVHFNKLLQDQKYDGLRRRVLDQKSQLQTMKPGEKLDDPNLWNDYVQFMGELSNRFESPLPFKYENKLTKDPDIADFLTAVVTYCEAYCCFMALLIAAKGKFAELGSAYKEDEDAVDRKISCEGKNAKEKLSFLSEERYLTFLGTLPYEGGKLTKIVVLSRNMRGKSLVEAVRGSLGLPEMQDLATVESAAKRVSCQSMKLKTQKYLKPRIDVSISEDVWPWDYALQFINETNFPMKVVSYRTRPLIDHLQFVEVVLPHAAYQPPRPSFYRHATPSTFGYLSLYLNQNPNEIPSCDANPPAEDARIIEFAFSLDSFVLNIQDKTNDEFTYGRHTYYTMNSKAKTLYWFENGVHYMARGEIVATSFGFVTVRFIIQDFDPLLDVQ